MKKIYSKPLTEVVTYNLATFIAASPDKVSDAEGLDNDLTPGDGNPSSFSKQYDLWDFDENN